MFLHKTGASIVVGLITRRQFFPLAMAGSCVAAGSAVSLVPAIEPIARTGEAKFKFSLAGYSYRRLLQGNPPALTLHDFVRDCASFGLEGTELTSYYFPDPVTPEYLFDLRRLCFRLGLDVSGTAVRNDFGLPPGPERDHWIAHVKSWVDYSAMLGAPVIRIFAGSVPRGSSPQEAHRRMVEGFEECCEYAGKHGIHLALENHGGPTATVEGLLALVRDVQSPWFGVNLDTGNFVSNDIYADLAKAAPYAINVQVKVVVTGPDGKKQPTDFARLASILRQAGYRGYIVLEYEEDGDPRTECRRYLDAIREAFR
jgi:sugar phosphate isomerase/epimerase